MTGDGGAGRFLARATFVAVIVAQVVGCAGKREAAGPVPAELRTAFPASARMAARQLAPGVRHIHIQDARGPWAIHVLEAEVARCDVGLAARKAGPPLAARGRTSELAVGMLAAVNADFFLIPAGTPTGTHVEGGEVLIGPGARPVFAAAADVAWMGPARLEGGVVRGRDTLALGQVNRVEGEGAGAVVLLTHWFGARTPGDSAALQVVVRRTRGRPAARAGVVTAVDSAGTALDLDTTRVVFAARGEGRAALAHLAVGDTVTWWSAVVPEGGSQGARRAAEVAVGGFPRLLRAGRPAADSGTVVRPEFGERRHPRTAVGVTRDGRLLLVVVDGRQEPYSAGMTLPELAWLMSLLGAEEALNLDGGGSTAMVVEGKVVNRPSDATGERPVANVLGVVRTVCPQ